MTGGALTNCTLIKQDNANKPYLYVLVIGFLLVGVIVNSVILGAIIRSNKLRKNAYVVLVLLLCVSDIVLCLNTLSCVIYFNLKVKNEKVNRIECPVIIHFFLSGIATSLGQTLLICINRLLASMDNIKANVFLFDRRRKYISTVIVFFAVQMYFLLIFAFRGQGDEIDYCDFCVLYHDGNFTAAIVLLNILFSGLYTSVLVSYITTICFIKSRFQRVIPGQAITVVVSVINQGMNVDQNDEPIGTQDSGVQTNDVSQSSSGKRPRYILAMKAMKTLGILLLFLSIFTLPFITVCILLSLHVSVPISVSFTSVAFVLIGCTSNPVLYTWRFPELRTELKKIFRMKRNNHTE